jgi:PleD family two-component response regulator
MILTPLPAGPALQLAGKLRDMVQHKMFGEGNSLSLSAGVAEYRKSMDISSFVAAAYDAMIEAKRGGGNRTVQASKVEEETDETAD